MDEARTPPQRPVSRRVRDRRGLLASCIATREAEPSRSLGPVRGAGDTIDCLTRATDRQSDESRRDGRRVYRHEETQNAGERAGDARHESVGRQRRGVYISGNHSNEGDGLRNITTPTADCTDRLDQYTAWDGNYVALGYVNPSEECSWSRASARRSAPAGRRPSTCTSPRSACSAGSRRVSKPKALDGRSRRQN